MASSTAKCSTLTLNPTTGNYIASIVLAYDATAIRYTKISTVQSESISAGSFSNSYTQ